MDSIIKILESIYSRLDNIDSRLDNIDSRLDNIDSRVLNIETSFKHLDNTIKSNNKECEKMGNHIDFIENIYENVKHPLGYICNNVKYYTSNKSTKYNLENTKILKN